MRQNSLTIAPPYAVEDSLKRLGLNLRTARLRRNLTIQQVAKKIGTGSRAVADAEKGKLTTGIGVYVALLWVFDLLDQLNEVAQPEKDAEGQILALSNERERARQNDASSDLDNDF